MNAAGSFGSVPVSPWPEGSVCLVGAGPGAADLLTLRAWHRLLQAEVVVHDRLLAPEVLVLLPPDTERLDVGKAAGHHSVPQAQIQALLIEHARRGRRVLRLKGGDPYLFGRGGEEVQALLEAGIGVEVVSGVTAASGCGAAAGIPLTHRDLARHCVLLPGHFADDTAPDWAALAQPQQTRVFYMGVRRLAHIAAELQRHGLAPDTPAALVFDGTRESQSVVATGLAALAAQAPAYDERPGLLIVGETVRLSPHYREAEAVAPAAPPGGEHYGPADRARLQRLLAGRRDMRHFRRGQSIEPQTLDRLLQAANQAPSVGMMQPWRYLRVRDAALRERIADIVAAERDATAAALGERAADFLRLKVEGIRECAELLVAALPPDDGTVFGRRTMPREMVVCSLACSIQNLWLAARVENLGLGWVSMFEPARLAELLAMPAGAEPLAILCLGPVEAFYAAPMLEQEGWRTRRPWQDAVYEDVWGASPNSRASSV
ncbi:5,6-dimethylbenzimidazole synthase [Rubrivivax gelatinosus]|uniref:uroporphyrinogen-III C-methyltransferase n=1 Tax=Rubrivivax gelatinosus TaxID=28068 RepID=UPI0019046E28|nr:5,6-dimethylbenzimidazole synthase [Rubrivivax gelatinosus]